MKIRSLEMFYEAANGSTFANISSKFDVSPSSVQRSLKALEDECGLALFYRQRNEIKLTNAGYALLAELDDIIPKVAQLRNNMKKYKKNRVIKVAAFTRNGFLLTNSIFNRFSREFDCVIEIVDFSSAEAAGKALEKDEVDFVLCNSLYYKDRPYYLGREVLVNDRLMVVVPVNHVLASQSSIFLEQLKNETLCSYPMAAACTNEMALTHGCTLRVEVRANSTVDLMLHTSDSGELSIVFESSALLLASPSVVLRPIEAEDVPICAFFKTDINDRLKTALLQTCKMEFRNAWDKHRS